ncbi:MAG: DUF1015 domain-containing protein [Candidatus Omnitrophica bacterium]|nr:DUF1015 domain-containing protein [Candidatus Omnitrophota bacterium]
MAVVCPFRGVLYNPQRIGDPSDVMAPPYDVISEPERAVFAREEYNIVHLDLPQEDTGPGDKYQNAAQIFKTWCEKEILLRDSEPAFYVCQSAFEEEGQTVARTGLIGRVRFEEESETAYTHERIFSGPMEDRLALMKSVGLNLSCVFSFVHQEAKDSGLLQGILAQLTVKPPYLSASLQGVQHHVWKIVEPETVELIAQVLSRAKVFIADGHHRFEAANRYRRWARRNASDWTPEHPANHVMMYLSPLDDPGLLVRPIHRVIAKGQGQEKWLDALQAKGAFEVTALDSPQALIQELENAAADPKRRHEYGLYLGKNQQFWLRLAKSGLLDEIRDTSHSEEWNQLEVTVLHRLVLERLLQVEPKAVGYKADSSLALSWVDQGGQGAVFLMQPTGVDAVRRIAQAGDRMPQKSTFFYPKLLSGMVLNPLTE